ncbi:MAG: hypothetical protein ABH827_05585 [bacterium]
MINASKFNYALIAITLIIMSINPSAIHAFQPKYNTIMIDPAGDVGHPERKLSQGYERAQTLAFAEALKQALYTRYGTTALLTRTAGEEIQPLQIASFANRLDIDFFLRIQIYKEESAKPKIFIYQRVQNPLLDFAANTYSPLDFIPLDQSHIRNINTSKLLGQHMQTVFTQTKEDKKKFDFYGPFGLPIAPLAGIIAPALLLEIGIDKDYKWQSLIDDIVDSLSFLAK